MEEGSIDGKEVRDLVARTMTVEQRARAAKRAQALLMEMTLGQLRKARLVAGITPSNIHGEISWDRRAGREVW